MTTTTRPGIFQPNILTLAIAIGIAAPAQAITFNIGEIEGQFDSSLSIGASWAVRNADPELVGTTNGGKAFASTGDDGRLNFKKGETFSKIFKGIHDLELRYGDTGVFTRGKYWYDFELKDEHRLFKEISDSNRKEGAKSSGAQILDAFVYHNYQLGDLPGSVRLGKQVVSWGESTFIGNSINSINPIDVAAFRRPGAEIKEGLIPVNMFYVSQSLTENLSAEAFYQLEWDQTVVDNCGTFFGSDVIADGCDNNLTLGNRAQVAALSPLAGPMGVTIVPEGLILPRGADDDARDQGQWGMALRWLGDDTEYGAYFINYHSRNPYYAGRTANAADITLASNLPFGGIPGAVGPTSLLGNGQYFVDYPEDIQLYGLSFATTLPSGTAWNGEISYRPNMPLQIHTGDVTGNVASDVVKAFLSGGMPGALAAADQEVEHYRRKEVTQAQTTLTHLFSSVLGADRLVVVGELGLTRIGGLEHRSEVRYGRATEFAPFPADRHGFFTSTSWGYRARGVLEYNNVLAGINLKPNLAWAHDVDGYGPVFNEGAKAVSLGLDADYANTYTASLSYTDFFGGDYNTAIDRDFVALSFGVNF
ncbi:hypothetical protein D3C80_404060 [compost metagenome]